MCAVCIRLLCVYFSVSASFSAPPTCSLLPEFYRSVQCALFLSLLQCLFHSLTSSSSTCLSPTSPFLHNQADSLLDSGVLSRRLHTRDANLIKEAVTDVAQCLEECAGESPVPFTYSPSVLVYTTLKRVFFILLSTTNLYNASVSLMLCLSVFCSALNMTLECPFHYSWSLSEHVAAA